MKSWVDLNVSVRATPAAQVSKIERPLRPADGIYDYKNKYLAGWKWYGKRARELPANVPPEIAERIQDYARRIQVVAGLTGIPRIDFLWDLKDEVILCEVNSIPGAYGLYLWHASGTTRDPVHGFEARAARRRQLA